MITFRGRLALQQRVLPSYRAPFFDLLAESCEGGLSLFAGQPRPEEGIATATSLRITNYALANNLIFSQACSISAINADCCTGWKSPTLMR